ncbi:MAG: phosphatase PAP2 family protein [Bacteroidota bacterium]
MRSLQKSNSLYAPKTVLLITAIIAGYLILSYFLVGFKMDQVWLALLFFICYFSSRITRKLITGFSIFILFWIIFDYMKAFPNYLYNTVHIESLYNAEKKLFGITSNGSVLTPNEYWLANHFTSLDALTGIFYLCWVPVPLAFAAYLFFKKRDAFLHFSFTFLLVNLLGFVVYYVYPAAPPWYVQQHGFEFLPLTPGNVGGLERFDTLFNTNTFHSLYAKSSNVFAAMPSLHASYPLIVLFYGIKNKLGKINIVFAVIMLGIWFAAVYNSHHYILDVLAGILCGTIGIGLFQWLASNNSSVQKGLKKFANAIA